MSGTVLPRITIYVPALVGGGAERAAAILASGFRARGCEVRLAVDFFADANRHMLDPRIPVVCLSRSHARSVGLLAARFTRAETDVVLTFGGAANVKGILAKLWARSRVPVVLSYHGRGDIGVGRLGSAAFVGAPVLTRVAAATVCVSESLVRHLVEDHHAARHRVRCIPNAVPIENAVFAASEIELEARPRKIVALGRLSPEKDFSTLIDAVHRLPSPVELVIHGEGPQKATLRAQVARLGLAGRVRFAGYTADPWPAYASARVFALTSLSEGFGNVVVEALASGLPVVATDCGGPREILESGRHGTLIPVGDVDALARALGDALEHPGDPVPRRAHATRYATSHIVDEYLALFAKVVR